MTKMTVEEKVALDAKVFAEIPLSNCDSLNLAVALWARAWMTDSRNAANKCGGFKDAYRNVLDDIAEMQQLDDGDTLAVQMVMDKMLTGTRYGNW